MDINPRGIIPCLLLFAVGLAAVVGAVRGLIAGRAPMFSRGGWYSGEARGVTARLFCLLYLFFGLAACLLGLAVLAPAA